MTCKQCGKPAKQTDVYDGIPIGTCEDGHRTGSLEAQYQIVAADWAAVESAVFSQYAQG